MNLLTVQEIAEANQAMRDVFDTFARDGAVRFYRAAKEVVITNPNFSNRWEQSYNNIPKTAEYMDFKCRVIFEERQPFDEIINGADKNIRYAGEYNRIYIHMLPEAFEYLNGVERFVYEGIQYKRDGTHRALGILGTYNVYEIKLQRVN